MRRITRQGLILALLLLLQLVFLQEDGWAEGMAAETAIGKTTYIDASVSQRAYGQQVALLNQEAEQQLGIQSFPQNRPPKELPRFAVLCRTDGRELAFAAWSPLYVVAGPSDCYTLFFGSEAAAELAVEELNATAGIRYAERDGEVTACGGEDYAFSSWGAEAMNFGAYLSYASQWGGGSATVAVIDSGVYLHPQLADRILESGYDYVDADDDATNDLFGHGTNVAGIVADCTAGEPVYLYPIRVLNASGGGSISNVTNAVREATEKGVDVINLSLESSTLSAALDDAILDAVDAGITVVVAAGNKTLDTAQISPAHLDSAGVVVVGALERNGSRSSYSNYGASVDLYAYGTGIMCCSRSGGYTSATGTSMAAPHISGLAAMLRLIHRGIDPASVEERVVLATDSAVEVNVPDLLRMIPERAGFQLTLLRMDADDGLRLPMAALPETALEDIRYQSSDETVVLVSEGWLIPVGTGTATVTARCTGLEPISFTVRIEDGGGGKLVIPKGVSQIEDEAFWGDGEIAHVVLEDGIESLGDNVFEECENLKTLVLPASLHSIGSNTFSGAVILCAEGSGAERYALENGFNYIIEKR